METCEKCGGAGKVRKFTDAGGVEAKIGVYCDQCLSGYLIDVYGRSSVGGRLTPLEERVVGSTFCWCGNCKTVVKH